MAEHHWDLRVAIAMAEMRQRGVAFSRQEMLRQRALHLQRAKEAERKARKAGLDVSLASPQQVAAGLAALDIDTGKYGKTGMSTDAEALGAALAECREIHGTPAADACVNDCTDQIKALEAVLAFREHKKVDSTYIVGYGKFMRNGVIKADWLYPGTETWRPRCRAPNLLNIPRGEFRKCVVSHHEGGSILSADYSQIELRVLASLSEDPLMLEIYRQGKDIHSTTARNVWGRKFTKHQRYVAKRINFGTIYGMSAPRLQDIL
ncbi:MAG: hypothetical protein GY700_08700, partial [Propionibacteriaceae bacterium]|nr:hypothetical protein [Propionibacteriaceae bacterium]